MHIKINKSRHHRCHKLRIKIYPVNTNIVLCSVCPNDKVTPGISFNCQFPLDLCIVLVALFETWPIQTFLQAKIGVSHGNNFTHFLPGYLGSLDGVGAFNFQETYVVTIQNLPITGSTQKCMICTQSETCIFDGKVVVNGRFQINIVRSCLGFLFLSPFNSWW